MHNSPSPIRRAGVSALRFAKRYSAPEQREQLLDNYKQGAVPPQSGPFLAGSIEEPASLGASKDDAPMVCDDPLSAIFVRAEQPVPLLREVDTRLYVRTGGDRHFDYHPPSPLRNSAEDEEAGDSPTDEAFTRSCVAAFSNLIGRRIARAMIDLVGIEPNPGPRTTRSMVLIGGRSKAEIRGGTLVSTIRAGNHKQRKSARKGLDRPARQVSRPNAVTHIAQNIGGPDASQYRRVLSNPWDETPVRLGGETMQPTGIATLVSRQTFVVSSAGNLSALFYPVAGDSAHQSLLFSQSAGPGSYTYTGGNAFPGAAALASIANGGRVISAGIRVMTLASSTNNQGILTIGCLPRELTGTGGNTINGFPYVPSTTATQGFNEFENYLSTETYPLKCGASCVFRPQDPLDYIFRAEVSDGYGVIPASPAATDLNPFFVVGVSGAAASSVLFFEIVAHIEYTVSEGTTGVINTGMGKMGQQTLIDSAKAVFGNVVDSTFEGVSGAFQKGLMSAGHAAMKAAALQGGRYFSSTVA